MHYIIKSSDASNGVINLNNKLEKELELHSFTFLNDIYNISSNNKILPYEEVAISSNIELTEQFTNGTDLATHIQTKINDISAGTCSVSFDANTSKFTITNTVDFKFNFSSYGDGTCDTVLGFDDSDLSYSTLHTSDKQANLTSFECLYIDFKNDSNKYCIDESHTNHSFIINCNSDFGDKCEYISKVNDFEPQKIKLKQTNRIEIKFYDQDNNELTLNKWCLVLKN